MPFSEFPQHTKQPPSEVSFSAYPISQSPTQAQDRQQRRSLALTPPYQSRSCRIYRIHRSVHPRLRPRAWHERPWPFPRQRFRRLIPPRASPLERPKTSPFPTPSTSSAPTSLEVTESSPSPTALIATTTPTEDILVLRWLQKVVQVTVVASYCLSLPIHTPA